MTNGAKGTLAFAVVAALVSLCVTVAFTKDLPLEEYAKRMRGRHFVLKAHEAIFSTEMSGVVNQHRVFAYALGKGDLGVEPNWTGQYFVSGRSYYVADADYKKRQDWLELKLICNGTVEFKLRFLSASTLSPTDIEGLMDTLFFKESENQERYILDNDKKLVENYFSNQRQLLTLPFDDQRKILKASNDLGRTGKPDLETVGRDLYLPARLSSEDSVYNDVRVSRNGRIASSVEAQLSSIKGAFGKVHDVPQIEGVRFYWKVAHRNFLREDAPSIESVELLVPMETLKELSEGNLSGFDLVQKSILRTDGNKITLTSYEPIGAR